MLDHISIGWRWLEQTFNRLIDEVNKQKPLQSASIAVEESPNGTLFKVVGLQSSDQSSSGGGAASKQKVVWNGVGWVTVTIVDPTTCAQSSLIVLAQKTNSSITIQ